MEIIIILFVLLLLYRLFLPQIKGFIGEKATSAILTQLNPEEYKVINDVMVKVNDKTTQIDHVVISDYGVFVIETKNYKGWIYGDERNQQWTQVLHKRKYKFYNPIHQNYGHVKALETLLSDLGDIPFIPIVVFSVNATLKTKFQSEVVYSIHLLKTIQKYRQTTLSQFQKQKIYYTLTSLNQTDKETKREHVQEIKATQANHQALVQQNICPKCGGQLVTRNGKRGSFIGCGSFPKCRFTA
ncbi:NERD domain-containing protein [Bacillus alkalicellulosilyticus]|uniref:NERD domain-containing protein n=1 Tax=Alkalihalobacterium alkalicellulosilyticum TaxID=1912214 RepID=UPI001116046D|nr:NERD domain-containing protein [Bacillus alkalicellulosilyticus]